eukprot:gene14582-19583_t
MNSILNALCGGFMEDDRSWIPFDGKLSVFFSSTFTDTHKERNILHQNILRCLQIVARPNKIPIMLVDMRWGVKDESTLNHQTWIECFKEIERCRNESTNLFFISLQSQKYGFRPLPYSILASDLEVRLAENTLQSCDINLIQTWYILDENADPPCYFLRHLTDIDDDNYWTAVLPVMIESLRGVPFQVCGDESFVVGQSVTEWEVRSAVLKNRGQDLHGVRWLQRQFSEPLNKNNMKYWEFDDTLDDNKTQISTDLTNLLDWMNHTGIEKSYYNQSSYQDFVDENDIWKSQLSRWEADVTKLLQTSMNDIIVRKYNWERDGNGFGLPGAVLTEMLHHYKWAKTKCCTFFGRDELIVNIMNKIYEPPQQFDNNGNSHFVGVHFAMVGDSGCGKTSLIAKVASLVFQREKLAHDSRPVIIRFCGTSPGSQFGRNLVLSLCLQIAIICEGSVDLASLEKMSYDEMVAKLHTLLNSHAVILFIDSLDQLSNENLARSHLTFLKNVKPHRNTRIIVSTLPDDRSVPIDVTVSNRRVKYFYGCETKLKSSEVPIFPVEELENPMDILHCLLEEKNRRLFLDYQTQIVSDQLMVEPTVLYVRIACEIVCNWRSTFQPTAADLPGGMIGIFEFLFNKVSVDYGPVLTKFAFGFLSYSLEGVSDDEMCDLLSLSEEVMNETIHHGTDHVVPTHRVPNHVWLRLRNSIASLITEQSGGCLKWYHRQLKEVAENWAKDKKLLCHEIMGHYFANIVPEAVQVEKGVSSQPLILNYKPSKSSMILFDESAIINNRRCQEAAHHLLSVGLIEEAQVELCSMHAVVARGKFGILFQYLDELGRLQNLMPQSIKARDYCRWIMHDVHILMRGPTALGCCTAQPLTSLVRKDFNDLFDGLEMCPIGSKGSWPVGRVFDGQVKCEAELNLLLGHEAGVTSVCFSSDDSKIASSSHDNTIRIWNSFTGQLLNTIEGRSGIDATSICFNYDGSRIVSGSNDKTVRIWDVVTGEVINELVGHSNHVNSVSFNYDGSRIVSGSWDNTIRIWDVITGEVMNVLVGHTNRVNSVCFNYDGSRILSSSHDMTIRIWDATTGQVIITLLGHSNGVQSVCFNYDGSRVVSGSYEATIRIWDVTTGEVISKLVGHSSSVNSVCFNPDGSRIVSGSYDNTIRIWDVITGKVISILAGHLFQVYSVCFNYDGSRIVSSSDDNTIRIWDVKTDYGHSSSVNSVGFNQDRRRRRIVSAGLFKNIVRIWDVISGRVINNMVGHVAAVCFNFVGNRTDCFNYDGSRIVSGSLDKAVLIRDVATGDIINWLVGHTKGVNSVCFNYDGGRIVSGSADKTVLIWDAITGKVISKLVGHSSSVNSVCFNYDGSRIVSGSSDKSVRLWHIITTSEYYASSDFFNHNGSRILSGSNDETVRIKNVTTGNLIYLMLGHSDYVNSVCFNFDGSRVVSCSSDKTIRIWDAINGHVIHELVGHSKSVTSVCFNFDGSRIVSGSWDNTVRIWDVINGHMIHELIGHLSW